MRAVSDVRKRFKAIDVHLISRNPTSGAEPGQPVPDLSSTKNLDIGIAESIAKHGIPQGDIDAYAEGIREGGSLVMVEAPFGSAVAARDILQGTDAATSENQVAEYPLSNSEIATPLSSILNLPVLIEDLAPLSRFLRLPLLASSSVFPSAIFGPLLLRSAAPFSSLTGVPLLLHRAAPLSSLLGLPLLSGRAAPFSTLLGLPLLLNRAAPLSSVFGLPLLVRCATPLSSLLRLPVLLRDTRTTNGVRGAGCVR